MYGVRQGSILGPLLYLTLVADMPACLGIYDEDNSAYADDTCIWAVANNLDTIGRLLTERAEAFYRFATGNCLKMNASKT
ncbi:Tick transposon, partial [Caligus rogercresseyi]